VYTLTPQTFFFIGYMSAIVAHSFDRAWQDLAPIPTHRALRDVLALQLGSPSFAVPVAHPDNEGAKAYAQVLFLPSTASPEATDAAFRQLRDAGRLIAAAGRIAVSCPHNLTAYLVLRPDDPACSAACHQGL